MPGNPAQTVTSIGNTAVNSFGGWAVGASVNDPLGTLSLIYGASFGAPASTLITEGTYGSLEQTSFESFFGVSNAMVPVYSPSSNDLIGGTTGLDGCWAGTTVIANEDDPILSMPGKVFRFNSRPNVIANGDAVWIGGVNDVSGTTEGNAVFRGAGHTRVVGENDVLPGMPFAVGTGSAVDFDFRFSPDGNHHILTVNLASGSSLNDTYVDFDGGPLFIGGSIVGEDELLPTALQVAPDEDWDNFDFFGVMDDGTYFFTGDTNGPTTTDEFIVLDGEMILREGDTVGGLVLSGSMEGGYLSARGDWGVIWDVDDPIDGNVEALLFNGRLIMKENDTIVTDLDGDGIPETGIISSFTGLSSMTVGIDRACYFTCDLDYLGTSSTSDDVEVAVRMPIPDLMADADSLSVATGGTVNFTLFNPPEADADIYLLLGSTSGDAPGFVVDGLTLPLNVDSYTLYLLQHPNQMPLAGSLGSFDGNGTASASFTLPPAFDPALAGLTVHHAFASFSFLTGKVTHTSNAVPISFLP